MMKRFKLSMIVGLLGLFGFTCFSNAGTYTYTGHVSVENSNTVNTLFSFPVPATVIPYNGDTYINCSVSNFSGDCSSLRVGFGGANSRIDGTWNNLTVKSDVYICVDGANFKLTNQRIAGIRVYSSVSSLSFEFDWSCTINGDDIITLSSSSCPEVNTGDILSGNCDTNYCVNNDLCPVYENSSLLFINDIEHQSAPVINITIPYEYTRDSSINSGQFDLTISGQNVDYEYIDGIIRTQRSSPNSTDFNNIITGLIPLFVPGLVIILFLWFIFKFIKKIF